MATKEEIDWHIRSLELSRTREFLGGIKAVDSVMFKTSFKWLVEHGILAEQDHPDGSKT
jgi:hypothetical protein